MHRLVPSVAAALSLAAAVGASVEAIFGISTVKTDPDWAWPSGPAPCRYWLAEVRGRTLLYPAEATAAGVTAHDGVFRTGTLFPTAERAPESTLVVACCDPAVSLLAAEYARSGGFRLLALPRPGRQALALLGRGLVHVAGIHFATGDEPDGNERVVRETVGGGFRLLRVACWDEGLAVAAGAAVSSAGGALRARLRWVGREPGSAARQCLDELLPNRRPPRRLAYDHRGVAEAVRCGWADVGVCHRLASEEAGLRFFSVRQEQYDLCYPVAAASDPRIEDLVRTVRSAAFRRLLGELPGYDTTLAGTTQTIR
jgi:molybdate-binding protein